MILTLRAALSVAVAATAPGGIPPLGIGGSEPGSKSLLRAPIPRLRCSPHHSVRVRCSARPRVARYDFLSSSQWISSRFVGVATLLGSVSFNTPSSNTASAPVSVTSAGRSKLRA